jgi:hypothetical protein
VVGVVVAGDHEVERIDAERAQMRDDLARRGAGIDQGRLAAFADDDGVTLSDIEKVNLELRLGRERGGAERGDERENSARRTDYCGRSSDRFVYPTGTLN